MTDSDPTQRALKYHPGSLTGVAEKIGGLLVSLRDAVVANEIQREEWRTRECHCWPSEPVCSLCQKILTEIKFPEKEDKETKAEAATPETPSVERPPTPPSLVQKGVLLFSLLEELSEGFLEEIQIEWPSGLDGFLTAIHDSLLEDACGDCEECNDGIWCREVRPHPESYIIVRGS